MFFPRSRDHFLWRHQVKASTKSSQTSEHMPSSTDAPAEAHMNGASNNDQQATERPYGGFTRFELELEFVQLLSNPLYLNHLAVQKYFDNPDFIEYLRYLQYFSEERYVRYLSYPGPTLRALELLQEERFRKDIIIPDVVDRMVREGFEAATAGLT